LRAGRTSRTCGTRSTHRPLRTGRTDRTLRTGRSGSTRGAGCAGRTLRTGRPGLSDGALRTDRSLGTGRPLGAGGTLRTGRTGAGTAASVAAATIAAAIVAAGFYGSKGTGRAVFILGVVIAFVSLHKDPSFICLHSILCRSTHIDTKTPVSDDTGIFLLLSNSSHFCAVAFCYGAHIFRLAVKPSGFCGSDGGTFGADLLVLTSGAVRA